MAVFDGEKPQLPEKEIQEHLVSCAACRRELEQLKYALGPLDRQRRRLFTEDVWPGIETCVEGQTAELRSRRDVQVFVVLGLFLLACRVLDVLPGITVNLVIKLMPIMAVIVLFGALKQNPFLISQTES